MPRRSLLLALLLAAPACGDTPTEPVARRVDLRTATGLATPRPVGIAIDPAGDRLVLDQDAGLYRVTPDGRATRVRALSELPDPGVPIRPPYTDLVALGDGQYALTAIGDGFLLDLGADTMRQYFCYEPGGFPDDQEQRTGAVGYDAATGKLYAQPRTFDLEGALLRNEVASYDRVTGRDETWRALPMDLDAGGLYAPGDGGLILGAGTRLYRYTYADFSLTEVDDLARFGVGAIAGLGHDPTTGTVTVLDGARGELVEVARADLAY